MLPQSGEEAGVRTFTIREQQQEGRPKAVVRDPWFSSDDPLPYKASQKRQANKSRQMNLSLSPGIRALKSKERYKIFYFLFFQKKKEIEEFR